MYGFTNKDYLMKFNIYLPDEADVDEMTDSDVDMYKQPASKNAKPTGYCLKLSGGDSGIKGQRKFNIIIISHAFVFINRFRELKEMKFKSSALG